MSEIKCRTFKNVSNLSFTWTIENFSGYDMKCGKYIESPEFFTNDDPDIKWRLKVYPNGSVEESVGQLSVCVLFNTSSNKKRLYGQATLGCPYGKEYFKRKKNELNAAKKFVEGMVYGFWDCISREELLSEKSVEDDEVGVRNKKYWFNNTLRLVFNVKFYPSCEHDTQIFHLGLTLDDTKNGFPFVMGGLLKSPDFSDVTFAVGNTEFKAHKCILSAWSPVFSAMFKYEFKESTDSRVEITDISANVFEAMLNFMYTEKLSTDDALDLLFVADKYDIEHLKNKCQEVSAKSMTVENAARILKLANLHNATGLKSYAIDFIRFHLKEVKETEGWKDLKEKDPRVIIHIFC